MEKCFNLLLANENAEESNLISEKLTNEKDIANIDIVYNGRDALKSITQNAYDLVILDLVLPEIDGFELIEQLKIINKDTKVIVISSLSSDIFIKKVSALGVNYYMLKPVSVDVLAKRCLETLESDLSLHNNSMQSTEFNKEIEEKITNIFITVGIPAHIKGYQFLREAIKLAMENPDIINSITKKLYPSIAERFSTSASKVERAIRHAIEVAWNRGKIENINNIFGLTIYTSNEKPTNGEFIALVADKMLLDV
ncbi:MAG: sporulation transcription factor Spo0A [Clostridia bacterium]|nr:sporulation transcription factor Spo0A [Clostridia bacterium]